MTAESLDTEQQKLSIRQHYVQQLATVLPAKKVARFFQVETRLDAATILNVTQAISGRRVSGFAIFLETRTIVLLLPATTQSVIKLHESQSFIQTRLGQRDLGIEVASITIQYFEVTGNPTVVTNIG